MADKVLPQLEVEEEKTPQESTNEVLEGAEERPLGGDTQEEFGLLPNEKQEENLECTANELPQLEVEEEKTPQESTNDVLEGDEEKPLGAAERSLSGDTQEEFGLLPNEKQEENLECTANELQEQEEQEEEEPPQNIQNGAVEGDMELPLISGSQEHVEVIVHVVASICTKDDSDGQVTPSPQTPRPGSPDGGSLKHDSCYLADNDDSLQDSGSSTGYYPCYNTYSQLPPLQLEDSDGDEPPKRPGTADASIQVGGSFQDETCEPEAGVEATPRGEEAKKKPHPEKDPLPPSPEEALGIDGQDQEVTPEVEQTPSAPSSPAANPPSRRGISRFVQWVHNIFSRNSPPRPPPSPSPAGDRRHQNIGRRLRGWIRKHRGRVHPHSG